MENMEIKGKTIFVTGGDGFVGSHLVEQLIQKGARIIVTERQSDPLSYFFQQKLYKKVICVTADVTDYARMMEIVTRFEVDAIYHLAAQSLVTTAYHDPLGTIKTNIMGTSVLLEVARQYNHIQSIIIASSDKAYGKKTIPVSEAEPLTGDHPYDVSKSAADLITQAYIKTYNTPAMITRFGNIYGPGDFNFNRIVPGIMQSIIRHQTLSIRSDGKGIRDYVYVRM